MQLWPMFQALALIAVANATPVFAKKLLGTRWAWPLDGGAAFVDGQPLFGASKTVRGIVLAVAVTALAAPLIGVAAGTGALIGAAAMAGDLCSSFAKRRMNRPPSSRALGLDQLPESFFPLLAARDALGLTAIDIALDLVLFLIGEILLSRLLYRMHLRDRPY